ncbi:MAG: methyl-accepting chemotaxis sensory transducer [Magnetococcales bacterium]|nr:methyl-accepting chemotaxis sensory transducer [Magnetococcales bacterium]
MLESLFSRYTVTFWMRWIAISSLAIFLTVIALNYFSIGSVQEMNQNLQSGPMEAKARWLSVALRFAQMETLRMSYLAQPSPEAATRIKPVQEAMAGDLSALTGDTMQQVRREGENYALAYDHVVQTITEKIALRVLLSKNREEVETQIYELDNKNLEGVLVELQVAELGYLANQTPGLVKSIHVILDRLARDSAGRASEAKVMAALAAYRKSFQEIVSKDLLVMQRAQEMSVTASKVSQLVEDSVRDAGQQAEQASRMARNKAVSAQWTALTWTIVGTVIAILLSFLFDRIFQSRIRITLEGFSVLSQGQLRFRFEVPEQSPNELYRINGAANGMANNLAGLLAIVASKVDAINRLIALLGETQLNLQKKTSDSLSVIGDIHEKNNTMDTFSRQVNDHADSTRNQAETAKDGAYLVLDHITTIAAASEQASANVTTMAAAAEEMTANLAGVNTSLVHTTQAVADVSKAIQQLDRSLDQVRERCEKAAEESEQSLSNVGDAQKIIQNLADATQEIGSVVELINNIADQTNMLALNATIEAAGAGSAGLGFAVVANEVKELAKQTSKATLSITDRIAEMQSQANQARSVMVGVVSSIVKVNDMNAQITLTVNDQSSTTRQISASIGEAAEAAESVSTNAQELNFAATEIARAAEEAASGTAEIARVASQTTTQAKVLHDSAETTLQLSQQAADRAKDISGSSSQVQDLGLRMMDETKELAVVTDVISGMVKELRDVAGELHQASTAFDVQG